MSDGLSVGPVGNFEQQTYETSAPIEETVSDEALVQADTSGDVAEIAITNDEVQQAFDNIYAEIETEEETQKAYTPLHVESKSNNSEEIYSEGEHVYDYGNGTKVTEVYNANGQRIEFRNENADGTFDYEKVNADGSMDIVRKAYDESGKLMEYRIHQTPQGDRYPIQQPREVTNY